MKPIKSEKITFRATKELLEMIESYVEQNDDEKLTRSKAIIELIETALRK